MTLKIFFPLQIYFPSQAGGPANTVYWLTNALVRHNLSPSVISADAGLPKSVRLNRWIKGDGARRLYVRTFFYHFPVHQTLRSLIELRRSDIVHLSSVFYPTAFVAALAARILKKPVVWSTHGELDSQALIYSPWKKRPVLWLAKKLVGERFVFHVTCEAEQKFVEDAFGKNVRIVNIPNYFELPPLVERKAADYLLFIGRIHPKKGIDNLIRGVALSAEFRKSDFKLKIAGSGDVSALRRLADELGVSERIEFVGEVIGEEKQRLFANAYFTIMPSHTENFGIVAIESLAQSTPVVASLGTPWEILEKERIGFWRDNSPEMLATVIDEILRLDRADYLEFRARSRPFVEREFEIERHIDEWINLYKSL